MRRAPQDVQLIRTNLIENYKAQFDEDCRPALLKEVLDVYIDNLRRDFIMNRIDGLTPTEAKLLVALLDSEQKKEEVKQEVKALEDSFEKAIGGKKGSVRKGKGS
jgi:hypothetical protein